MNISNLDFVDDIKVESLSGGRRKKSDHGNGSSVKANLTLDRSTQWEYRATANGETIEKRGMGDEKFELFKKGGKVARLWLKVSG